MALALPVLLAVTLGLLLGGRLGRLAELPLRATWLFFAAVALQVVAYPFGILPWETGQRPATALWLASYGLLIVAVLLNRRISGVPLVGLGMSANVAAIVSNGGTMPVLPDAMRDAGRIELTQANSTAISQPNHPWLVDRWAAPEWIPFANVYSVGDVLIAVGAFAVVLAAMRVPLPRIPVPARERR